MPLKIMKQEVNRTRGRPHDSAAISVRLVIISSFVQCANSDVHFPDDSASSSNVCILSSVAFN